MRELFLHRGDGLDIAVMEDGRLVEYLPADADASSEAVYLGRVERIMPGMKAAFIQIGQKKCGFLPLEERNLPDLPKLQTGMSVLVQVRKEAQGVKGAFLSRDICLCGETVLFAPLSRRCGVSSRITGTAERKALKEMAQEISGGRFGLVMRTASAHAPEEQLRAEVDALRACWNEICKAAHTAHVPSVLHAPRTTLELVLADYHPRGIDRISTNDASLADALSACAPVRLMGDDLFDVAGVSNQVLKALERRVWLESGGNLVFDPCEAMTVIDVNTAKFVGKSSLPDTVLRTNLEACQEAARQIRLRNISGIIIIDMIDMNASADRRAVLSTLADALAADRVKTVIHGFTALGLIELTRRRTRPPLRETMKKKQIQEDYSDG